VESGIISLKIIPEDYTRRNEEMKLDKEERKIVKSYEKGEWRPGKNFKSRIKQHQECARATFRKDKRVNIRISSKDLEGIQIMALEEGFPYQTFLASVIHKYVLGKLRPIAAPRIKTNSTAR